MLAELTAEVSASGGHSLEAGECQLFLNTPGTEQLTQWEKGVDKKPVNLLAGQGGGQGAVQFLYTTFYTMCTHEKMQACLVWISVTSHVAGVTASEGGCVVVYVMDSRAVR